MFSWIMPSHWPLKHVAVFLLYFHVEQECKVNAEYGFSSISHCLLDAFLCVCVRTRMPTQALKHSLVQSSKTPMKIDLCGEGSRLAERLQLQSGAKDTNPWCAVGWARNLRSDNSTPMEHCFSLVPMSVEGWLFRVQCWARSWHKQT